MVTPIAKIQITALENKKEAILNLLADRGVSEILSFSDQKESASTSVDYDLAQVSFALDFLNQYDDSKIPLKEKLVKEPIEMSVNDIKKLYVSYNWKEITEECTNLEARITNKLTRTDLLKQEEKDLLPWKKTTFLPIETDTTISFWVSVKTDNFAKLETAINKLTDQVYLERVWSEKISTKFAVLISKNHVNKLKEIFDQYKVVNHDFTNLDSLPIIRLEDIKFKLIDTEEKISALANDIARLIPEKHNLKIIHDELKWKKELEQAGQKLYSTKKTFSILAWMPASELTALEKKIEAISPASLITEIEIKEDENVPVIMKNNSLIQPFEAVTNVYGSPLYSEPDPTPLLAPFFFLFFGLALTDAGYGIVLAVGAWLAIKLLKVPRDNQRLFRVLMYGGVSTFILGALFGSWFGIVIDKLPQVVQDAFYYIQVLDPVKEPITLLLITMALGVFQVLVGIGIGMWWKLKQKKYLEAFLDHALWIYFIISILGWSLSKMEALPASLESIFYPLLLVGLVALVLTQGRKSKSIISKFLVGTLSLYNLVGYFSDVLSYARLLALGLATGIIASVVNLVAFLFKDMIPVVGWPVAILILVGGHAFNLGINVLGAFIHSGRLQYVEFFPKFMEGGGRVFKPFRRQGNYITLKK